MSEITGIHESRGLIEIYIDGARALSVRKKHFEKCALVVGDDIDIDEYMDRLAVAQFADAYETALTSLDSAERTGAELIKSLIRRGYVRPAAEAVVEKLRDIKLVDDARYAERLVGSAAKKPVGVIHVRRKLQSKGISASTIDEAVDALDGEQQSAAALAAAQKLYKKYAALPEREARAKLSMALARRGFTWSAVESAVDKIITSI